LYHNPELVGFAELQEIEPLSDAELDALPFGAIKLDIEGTILSFNQHERERTGRVVSSTVGKNFFTDVAPCTNVQDFAGRFRKGVASGTLHAIFPYRFEHERIATRRVWVTLYYSRETGTPWVFVRDDRG
jgi:photoactive yellow protein